MRGSYIAAFLLAAVAAGLGTEAWFRFRSTEPTPRSKKKCEPAPADKPTQRRPTPSPSSERIRLERRLAAAENRLDDPDPIERLQRIRTKIAEYQESGERPPPAWCAAVLGLPGCPRIPDDSVRDALAECGGVRWDVPDFLVSPTPLDESLDRVATDLALTDEERARVGEETSKFARELEMQLKALYAVSMPEGSAKPTGALGVADLLQILMERYRTESDARASAAAQVYGDTPPSELPSNAERFYLTIANAGAEMEARVAEAVGPGTARRIRETWNTGGGVVGGCPPESFELD